jgi:hypothetical protein
MIGWVAVVQVADRLTPAVAREVVRWGLGAGLVASTVITGPGASAAGRAPPAIAMTPIPARPTATTPPVPPAAPTWEVRPGENLWAIASHVVAARIGREPSDREVIDYWRALIDVNRPVLVDPDDADLIRPGQRFRLP